MSNNYQDDSENQPDKPFNDVIDHMNKIEGGPINTDTKGSQLPKPIRFIGYFIIVCVVLFVIAGVIGSMLN